jgi:hypothetical protein
VEPARVTGRTLDRVDASPADVAADRGAVLGVVVLGETLNTGRAGTVALVAAAPVLAAASFKLALQDQVNQLV